MNNDVNVKEFVLPTPPENFKKEQENREAKKEHDDNHPKVKEPQLKKEPDNHHNVQQQMRKR